MRVTINLDAKRAAWVRPVDVPIGKLFWAGDVRYIYLRVTLGWVLLTTGEYWPLSNEQHFGGIYEVLEPGTEVLLTQE